MSKVYNQHGAYVLVVCPNPSVDIYAWLEKLDTGAANRITREEHYPGGKGIHVAMTLSELKIPVKILGFWGGPTGQWIKDSMGFLFSTSCYGPKVQGWTRSCYTFKAESDFDDTELLGTGPGISDADVQEFYKSFDALAENATAVVMSGSWPAGAPENGYAELIRRAHKHQKITVLDCAAVQFKNAIKERPTLIHLNRSETAELVGDIDLKKISETLASKCDFAAITDGSKGLYLLHKDRIIHANCTIDRVYSSVGSGDCLTASMTAALVQNFSVEDMAKMGVAGGAANCLRKELGQLRSDDVKRLFAEATIENLQFTNSNLQRS